MATRATFGDRRLKVAFLVASLETEGAAGGVGRFVSELCQRLNPERFDVALYSLWFFNAQAAAAAQEGLKAAGVRAAVATAWNSKRPHDSFWRAVRELEPLLAQRREDILHSHHEFGDVAALILGRWCRVRHVLRTVHNEEWKQRPLRRLLLTGALYPLSFRAEAAVSRALATRLNARPLARILGRRAQVLPNAINLKRFEVLTSRESARRDLGLPADAFVIGSVGRLTSQKGYRYLLEATPAVLRDIPGAYFVIVGQGNLNGEYRSFIQSLGLTDRVLLTGARHDVNAVLSAMDLFVSPSLWEGLPTAVLEAMAAGIPIIATKIAGTEEVIQDNANGRLVEPAQASVLANAIVELASRADLRLRFAQRAKETVRSFSIDPVAAQHEALYEAVMSGQRPDRV